MLSEPTDFRGGVAVITGAGSGIGAGLVSYAAGLGMRIALADIDLEAIERRRAELTDEGREAIAQRVDVRQPGDLEALAEAVYGRWGTVTMLVNNAGVELHGNTWELPVEMWQRIVDINLSGVFYGIRAFVPRMIAQGSRAHVVNVASVAALRINPGTGAYGATKHGTLALTECLAAELAAVTDDVIVTAVLPGAVRTQIFERAMVADTVGPGARGNQQMREHLKAHGIDPVQAAEMIFTGASRGDLRVHTDPEISRACIKQRAEDLSF
jgi:NAD(P)-dependent dehydrogenase (short-subunit alcohol dehydrogenase family)